MSFFRNNNPEIDIPKPKRAEKKQKLEEASSHRQLSIPTQEMNILKYFLGQGMNVIETKKKQLYTKQSDLPFYIVANLQYDELKNHQMILSIIEYIYDEVKGIKTGLVPPFKALYKWEVQQINTHTKDTNLGDFVIKCPNPDNLPESFIQQFPQLKENDENVYVNLVQALQIYEKHFATKSNANQLMLKNQQKAFFVTFMLLDIQGKVQPSQLHQQREEVSEFQILFSYFQTIIFFDSTDYLTKRKSPEFSQQEENLPAAVRKQILNVVDQLFSVTQKEEGDKIFANFQQKIYKNLQQKIENRKYGEYDPFLIALFLHIPSLTQLFHYFPFLFKDIVKASENLSSSETRRLCKGGYLKKVIQNDQLKWILAQKKPNDLLTLIRKFLMYKLTQRGGLFLRTFLSHEQTSIFLVLKSSQKVLEQNAQLNSTKMEIELGSTDLFSFQPVDSYYRPLRAHRYIRDPEFVKKYNLNLSKEDKDEFDPQNSIESQALNHYKRAEQMNRDELRAKIILDQEQADNCYRWLRNKLGINYISSRQVLINEHNREQIKEDIWEIYFVYNKFIIEYVKRVQFLYKSNEKDPHIIKELDKNIGMLLRLMFLKALYECNNLFYNYREMRGLTPRWCSNLFRSKKTLKNIWDHLDIEVPKGFWTYVHSDKYDRLWRKYQINQLNERSKFYPSSRLIITNSIIKSNLNLSSAISGGYILDVFPIHDPYVLKSIKISPYLNVIRSLLKNNKKAITTKKQKQEHGMLDDMFVQYKCPYSQHDFTEDSIEKKLGFQFGKVTKFSIDSVRYYCGEKLAIYFQFRRFLADQSFTVILIAFIIQILFWVQIAEITWTGKSQLKYVNDVFAFIMAIINCFWVTKTIIKWKNKEKEIARSFGVDNISEENNKRIMFRGNFKRKMENDEMNYEYVPAWEIALKYGFTFLITLTFVILMAMVIIQILVFKSYLFQIGADPQVVSLVPSILISVSIQIFNFIYTKLIKFITDFENHKTVDSYQSSLTLKAFIVNFLVTFYPLLIYSFFAPYIYGEFICRLKTSNDIEIVNCYYFLEIQLLTLVVIDLVLTIIGGFIPYISFQVKQYLSKQLNKGTNYNKNYFQTLDRFYEEQDKMDSYMYNEEIDGTWLEYTKIIIIFSVLSLFGGIFPFAFVMLYLTGAIGLHSGKFQIIYLKKRSLPIRTNSINVWLIILDVVSVLGIFINFSLVIFVRDMFEQSKATVFFFLIICFLLLKFILSVSIDENGQKMFRRNLQKTTQILHERGLLNKENIPALVNTDIENVFYNQSHLKRKLPKFLSANFKVRAKLN